MTQEYETLEYHKDGQLCRVELQRPQRLNAVSMVGANELLDLAKKLERDKEIRMVVFSGQGRAFCTGIDLKDLATGIIDITYFDMWDSALRIIEQLDKLVLCLIHGYAVGGGLQLGLACDIRICTRSAKMGLPAIKEGLIPGLGVWRLARYIGMGRAKSLIIRGNMIDGEEAERIGLVDHLIGDSKPQTAFEDWIQKYASANSAGCRYAKSLLLQCFDKDYEAMMENYLEAQQLSMNAPDFDEAMAAYNEKRDPIWG